MSLRGTAVLRFKGQRSWLTSRDVNMVAAVLRLELDNSCNFPYSGVKRKTLGLFQTEPDGLVKYIKKKSV